MRRPRHVIGVAICAAVVCGCVCRQAFVHSAEAAVKPRVTRKKGLPIFPDADNSLCLVCHIDFDGEELTLQHVKRGLTCESCHGPSDAHMSDEMANTKPDVLYGRAEVEPLCRKCHGKHRSPEAVEAFRQKWLGKHRPNGRSVQDDSPCTDCHGKHVILKAGLAAQ